MREIFKEILLSYKFELPDAITMNQIKLDVEKRIDNIYSVSTKFIDEDGGIFILQYADKTEIIKNSELIE